MATPIRTAAGTWRVQIEVRGARDANTLPTKREAQEWAARRSVELRAGAAGREGDLRTLADAMQRYAKEVTPGQRGWHREVVRLKAFCGSEHALPLKLRITQLTSDDLVRWRDRRLALVSRGSVLRDMTLLGGGVAGRLPRVEVAGQQSDARCQAPEAARSPGAGDRLG